VSEPESREVLDSPDDDLAHPVRDGLSAFGRLLGRAASHVGSTIADAYMALDPDLKRHLAQMPLVGLTMLAPGRPKVEARGEGDATAVLFVHGLGGHRGNFIPMLGYFWWEGSNRTYAVGFEERASLQAMAEELRSLIAEVAQVNDLSGERTVDLVAHSMGGLVCRIALEDQETRARIRKLITLGTPHAGTHVARFLTTQSALALRPDSDLLERLDAQLPWAGPPTWPEATTYWSRADIVVLPPEAARLDGASSPEQEGMTHYGYLLHPAGWRAVYETLYGTVTHPEALNPS
jgi:pimeloyl-ACP methyl ester carboxylesterase